MSFSLSNKNLLTGENIREVIYLAPVIGRWKKALTIICTICAYCGIDGHFVFFDRSNVFSREKELFGSVVLFNMRDITCVIMANEVNGCTGRTLKYLSQSCRLNSLLKYVAGHPRQRIANFSLT